MYHLSSQRFTQVDVSIIQNCERYRIPLFIVRSKADMHIRNIMQDIGYDEIDDNADVDFDDFQRRARQMLIDTTRKNLEDNLEKAKLKKHDVFIVSGSVIFSLVAAKQIKRTIPAIDEARLMDCILKMALSQRCAGPDVRHYQSVVTHAINRCIICQNTELLSFFGVGDDWLIVTNIWSNTIPCPHFGVPVAPPS